MKHFSLKPVFATNYLEDGFLPYSFGHVCSINSVSLKDLHEALCQPGVTRLSHYVRTKNL